jgi:hypothetical protein
MVERKVCAFHPLALIPDVWGLTFHTVTGKFAAPGIS